MLENPLLYIDSARNHWQFVGNLHWAPEILKINWNI